MVFATAARHDQALARCQSAIEGRDAVLFEDPKAKSSLARKRVRVSGRECVGAMTKRLLTDNGKLHRPDGDVCDCRAGRDQDPGTSRATTADSATIGELVAVCSPKRSRQPRRRVPRDCACSGSAQGGRHQSSAAGAQPTGEFLANLETRRGWPARIVPGNKMPENGEPVLPGAGRIGRVIEVLHCCSVCGADDMAHSGRRSVLHCCSMRESGRAGDPFASEGG